LEAAVFIGGPPALWPRRASALCVDEYGLAGALNGAAIDVVQAETFDAVVPAHAEIVLEGIIRTDVLEPKRRSAKRAVISVRARWRRFSKSLRSRSVRGRSIRASSANFRRARARVIARRFDAIYLKHLRDACNIPSVRKVASYEMASCNMMFVFSSTGPRRATVAGAARGGGRSIPRSGRSSRGRCRRRSRFDGRRAVGVVLLDAAASRRRIVRGKVPRSIVGCAGGRRLSRRPRRLGHADQCCREHPYLPVSLPRQDFMERRWALAGAVAARAGICRRRGTAMR